MLDRVKGIEAFPSVGGVGGLQDVMEPMSHLITAGGLERHANKTHTHAQTHTYSIKRLQMPPLDLTPVPCVSRQDTQHNDIINSRTLLTDCRQAPQGSPVAGIFSSV